MCRLVSNPLDIIQFLDQVVPALNRIVDIGGDPEMVSVTARALITLNRVSGIPVPDHLIEAANFDASKPKISSLAHSTTKRDLEKMEALTTRLDAIKQRKEKRETELEQLVSEMKTDDTASVPIPTVSSADILNLMIEKISSDKSYNLSDPFISTTLDYVSKIIEILIKNDVFDLDRWEDEYVIPYLEGIFNMNQLAESICRHVYHRCQDIMGKNNNDSDSDIDGEYVANCEFSLGYGAMVLLRKARMKLKPGHRYGICGANGCGKSTLLKAIAKGQVDGFPSQDKVRTFMVADELQASDADTKIIDLMANDPKLSKHSREKIADTLTSVGFTTSTQNDLIGSLSGGWKMKLALARGILMEAHLLLLDEPYIHLTQYKSSRC